jgi:hypothetical protein
MCCKKLERPNCTGLAAHVNYSVLDSQSLIDKQEQPNHISFGQPRVGPASCTLSLSQIRCLSLSTQTARLPSRAGGDLTFCVTRRVSGRCA